MNRLCLAVLFVGIVTACAGRPTLEDVTNKPDRENWLQMVGFWYAEIPLDDGSVRRSLVRRGSDGIMEIEIETVGPDGSRRRHAEVLRWGVHGDVYMTELVAMLRDGEIRQVHSYHPSYHVAYKIRSLTPERFVYQAVDDDHVFTLDRIEPTFDISDVPMGGELR